MEYSFFLFVRLLQDCSTILSNSEMPYDIEYEYILRLYMDYDNSTYNDSNKDEYQCMVNYIKHISQIYSLIKDVR